VDEVASSVQETRIAIGEITRDLFNPFAIGLSDDSGNLDSTSLKVDDEEHEVANQTYPGKYLNAEKSVAAMAPQ
jgi:hypothetical protein